MRQCTGCGKWLKDDELALIGVGTTYWCERCKGGNNLACALFLKLIDADEFSEAFKMIVGVKQ